MEEVQDIKHQKPLIDFVYTLRKKLIEHPTDSGCCLILCGRAHTFKSTINRILGLSFAPYALWPGSQWVQRDILKYDDAARNGVSTIVVEEMEWVDLQHRKTLESTLNSIKEHLSGDGLDVPLAKNQKVKIEGIKFKMNYCLISMNPGNIVNYEVLNTRINSKEEWKRRFYVIDMDNPAMQSLY